ncbi:MAG: mycothiol system anti-sigma-R factor [Gemmatimonadetes bacterium]|nr:mycothiol system anti-sigma-R factor [Gemmatimonadota bacterium]
MTESSERGNDPLDLDCREVFRRLDDYVDGSLPAGEILAVRDHLDACGPCADEYGFNEALVNELKAKLRTIGCPDRLRAWIAERTRRDSGTSEQG